MRHADKRKPHLYLFPLQIAESVRRLNIQQLGIHQGQVRVWPNRDDISVSEQSCCGQFGAFPDEPAIYARAVRRPAVANKDEGRVLVVFIHEDREDLQLAP